MSEYPLEDVRRFFMRRSWIGTEVLGKHYVSLKNRTLALNDVAVQRLRSFMYGYNWARPAGTAEDTEKWASMFDFLKGTKETIDVEAM
jgi:hypothetical protein